VEASTRFALNLKDFFFFPFLLAKKAAVSVAVSDMVVVGSSSFPCTVTNLGPEVGGMFMVADKNNTKHNPGFVRKARNETSDTDRI
jgi:hypothetical protein